MSSYKPRARKCVACAARVIIAETGDPKRYSCVTGKLEDGVETPPSCWQRRFEKAGRDILAAIVPVSSVSKKDQRRLREKLEVAEAIATLAEAGPLTSESIADLCQRFGRQRVGRVSAAIPESSPIAQAFKKYRKFVISEYNKAYWLRNAIPSARPQKPLYDVTSTEFQDAINQWSAIYEARAKRKLQFGHPYSPLTLARVTREAKRFCAYLESDGITLWVNVAQRHIDGYIAETTQEAAQRAYTFLRFVTKRFRIRSQFKRPANRKPHVRPRLVSMTGLDQVLDCAKSSSDTEVMLALFLVVLYGQTLAALLRLTTEDITETESGYQIKFNEAWIPLDDETSEIVRRHLAAREAHLSKKPGSIPSLNLFWCKYAAFGDRVAKITKIPLKNLRITALANILKTGFTDRHGLHASLGVSQATVATLERVCGWDFQSAVSDEAAQIRRDLIDGKLSDR